MSLGRDILSGSGVSPDITLPNSIEWIRQRADALQVEGKALLDQLKVHDQAAAKIRGRLTEIRGILQNYEKDIDALLSETKAGEGK